MTQRTRAHIKPIAIFPLHVDDAFCGKPLPGASSDARRRPALPPGPRRRRSSRRRGDAASGARRCAAVRRRKPSRQDRARRRPRPGSPIVLITRRQTPRPPSTSGLRLAAGASDTAPITIRAPRGRGRTQTTTRLTQEGAGAAARRRVRRPRRHRVRRRHLKRPVDCSPSSSALRGPSLATAGLAPSPRPCSPPPGNAPRRSSRRRRTCAGSTGSCALSRCNSVGTRHAPPPILRSGGG